MSWRSDLQTDAVWATRLPPETPLRGEARFAGNEIIEAAARLEEHWLQEHIGVTPEDFEEWRRERIEDVYKPAYEYLLANLKDVTAARTVIDVTLMTPIDPAFAAAAGGVLFVEDVLPSFRLPRVVEAALNSFWPVNRGKRGALAARQLAEAAGLVTPERVAQVGAATLYSGENSWDYDERQHNPEASLGKPYVVAQADVRRAMQKRLVNPSSILMREDEPDAIRPLLMFFEDVLLLSSPTHDLEELPLYAALDYQKFITDGLHLALIGEFDSAELLHYERVILDRISGAAANDPMGAFLALGEEQRRQIFGVRELALRFADAEHLYLFGL